jgi:hypothetical protein
VVVLSCDSGQSVRCCVEFLELQGSTLSRFEDSLGCVVLSLILFQVSNGGLRSIAMPAGTVALENSERRAEEGDVDSSMVLAKQAEALRASHESLLKTLTLPERTMTVCDVCGVFINSTDNEARRQVLPFPVSLGGQSVGTAQPSEHILPGCK